MGEEGAFLKARQRRVPSGMGMLVSLMTEAGVDKCLSQAEGEVLEKDTSAVNHTGEPEDEEAEEEGRKAFIRRGVEGPTQAPTQALTPPTHPPTHTPP